MALVSTTLLGRMVLAAFAFIATMHELSARQSLSLSPGLAVSATYEAKLVPDKVRLSLPVRVETRESDTLLKTLKIHQADVKKHLVASGVASEAIEFSEPTVTASVPGVADPEAARKAARQQAIQTRNLNPQMRNQFPIPPVDAINDIDLPIVYAAETNLTVDWKLEKGLDEQALLLPSKIKTLMDEKDFSGKQLREVLTAEEQKLIEPLLGTSNYYVQSQLTQRDQRVFYVGDMTEAIEKAAIAAASKIAKNDAVLLAESAGVKLGKLRSIQKNFSIDIATQQANAILYSQLGGNVPVKKEKNEREVTNLDPNGLRRVIQISMVFDID